MSFTPPRLFLSVAALGALIALFALGATLGAADASPNGSIAELGLEVGTGGATIDGPRGSAAVAGGRHELTVRSDRPIARLRLQAGDGCDIGRLPDITNGDDPFTTADDDPGARFTEGRFTVEQADATCEVIVNAWYENHRWAGHVFATLTFGPEADADPEPDPLIPAPPGVPPLPTLPAPDPEPEPDPPVGGVRHDLTVGTDGRSPWDTTSPVGPVSAHGSRIYCPISHFSHDDPVVFPGQPGRAHLHMFWGNTGADAFSTGESLLTTGNSSCEGGLNNRSSYWMPALFNERDEVVVPETTIVYYKSFGHNDSFDRSTIMPIPNGLEMLADTTVTGAGPWAFSVTPANIDGRTLLVAKVLFPACLAVDASGEPVLASDDNTAHLAYPSGGSAANHCPASHPYRIPQLSYNVRFDVPADSDWYLASDIGSATQGESLHADYIAAWDEAAMDGVVACNREHRRSCEFVAVAEDGSPIRRTQLPDRFRSPTGEAVYTTSVELADGADRTPFGNSLTPVAADGQSGHP